MNTRLKYQLKAILTPKCWFRLGVVDTGWDKFLWNALDQNKIKIAGKYEAIIDDSKVWIANAPYANGYLECTNHRKTCSRATALYLQDQIECARIIQRLKGMTDTFVLYREHGISF